MSHSEISLYSDTYFVFLQDQTSFGYTTDQRGVYSPCRLFRPLAKKSEVPSWSRLSRHSFLKETRKSDGFSFCTDENSHDGRRINSTASCWSELFHPVLLAYKLVILVVILRLRLSRGCYLALYDIKSAAPSLPISFRWAIGLFHLKVLSAISNGKL